MGYFKVTASPEKGQKANGFLLHHVESIKRQYPTLARRHHIMKLMWLGQTY
jgi:hypothetical protein